MFPLHAHEQSYTGRAVAVGEHVEVLLGKAVLKSQCYHGKLRSNGQRLTNDRDSVCLYAPVFGHTRIAHGAPRHERAITCHNDTASHVFMLTSRAKLRLTRGGQTYNHQASESPTPSTTPEGGGDGVWTKAPSE